MGEVKSPGKWRQVRRNAGKGETHGDRWEGGKEDAREDSQVRIGKG